MYARSEVAAYADLIDYAWVAIRRAQFLSARAVFPTCLEIVCICVRHRDTGDVTGELLSLLLYEKDKSQILDASS